MSLINNIINNLDKEESDKKAEFEAIENLNSYIKEEIKRAAELMQPDDGIEKGVSEFLADIENFRKSSINRELVNEKIDNYCFKIDDLYNADRLILELREVEDSIDKSVDYYINKINQVSSYDKKVRIIHSIFKEICFFLSVDQKFQYIKQLNEFANTESEKERPGHKNTRTTNKPAQTFGDLLTNLDDDKKQKLLDWIKKTFRNSKGSELAKLSFALHELGHFPHPNNRNRKNRFELMTEFIEGDNGTEQGYSDQTNILNRKADSDIDHLKTEIREL